MYDAIVVGARCAGAPTAMLLARRGYRVLLLDKGHFPSDTVSSHYLHQPGVALLKRWRLLDRVAATDAPPVTELIFDAGVGARLVGSAPAWEGVVEGYCVRRKILDRILLDAAIEAGAEFREGFTVTELLREGVDDRVVGVRGHAFGGSTVTERTRLVIGADGVRSMVARAVDAPFTRYVPPITCVYYSYFENLPCDETAELYPRDGCTIVAVPTNDRMTLVTVVWPADAFERVRVDVEGHWMRAIQQHVPDLHERLRAAHRTERFYGTPMLPNYLRRPWGGGWALVGDAGYMKDPITAQGMTDAFRDADALAAAAHAGFAGTMPMDDALAAYERNRNEQVREMFEHTCAMARLEPTPSSMVALFNAIQDKPEAITRFYGTIAGTTSIREFFSHQNLQRLLDGLDVVAA